MPFPGNTTTLDSFTGGLGSRWTNVDGTAKAVSVGGNGAISQNGTTGGFFYYNVSQFSDPVDFYTTFAGNGANGQWAGIAILQNPGVGTTDGYIIYFEYGAHPGGDVVSYWQIDNGSFTKMGADEAWTYSVGDKLGLQLVSGALNAWVDDGGGWTQYSTRTATTYSGNFYVGYDIMYDYDLGGAAMDDLSGGAVSATGRVHRLMLMGCGI